MTARSIVEASKATRKLLSSIMTRGYGRRERLPTEGPFGPTRAHQIYHAYPLDTQDDKLVSVG